MDTLGTGLGGRRRPARHRHPRGLLSLSSVRVLDDAQARGGSDGGQHRLRLLGAAAGHLPGGLYRDRPGETEAQRPKLPASPCFPTDASAQLATAPVIAFVHPKEDVTVDVFTAVANPTRRVLLLSDVHARMPRQAPACRVDVVAQNFLRVSGHHRRWASEGLARNDPLRSSATERRTPGRASRERRRCTCCRRRPTWPRSPSTMRSWCASVPRSTSRCSTTTWRSPGDHHAQPRRSPLDRSSRRPSPSAPGRSLRYLAPEEPGDYTVELLGCSPPDHQRWPTTATVRVRGDRRGGESLRRGPETLEGRVLSGEAYEHPLPIPFGVDPDGDDVSLDRITCSARERFGDDLRRRRDRSCTRAFSGYQGQVVVRLPRHRRRWGQTRRGLGARGGPRRGGQPQARSRSPTTCRCRWGTPTRCG